MIKIKRQIIDIACAECSNIYPNPYKIELPGYEIYLCVKCMRELWEQVQHYRDRIF